MMSDGCSFFLLFKNLAENKLTVIGVKYIVEVIIEQDTIHNLSFAGKTSEYLHVITNF